MVILHKNGMPVLVTIFLPRSLICVQLKNVMDMVRTIYPISFYLSFFFQERMHGSNEPESNCSEAFGSTQDDFVVVQVGGGHREPSPPVVVTPTRLCQRIKATTRDTGLVRDTSFRRSYMTPTKSSVKDTSTADNDDNPFLSEPTIQTAAKAQTDTSMTIKTGTPFVFINGVHVINLIAVTEGDDTPRPSERAAQQPGSSVAPLNTLSGVSSAPAARRPGPLVDPLDTLSGAPSAPTAQKPGPSVSPLDTLPGAPPPPTVQKSGISVPRLDTLSRSMPRPLGLSAALDSLGFEPAESVQIPISHVGV